MQNLKLICQGEVYKIDKSPSLSVKTLKNMTLGKDGTWNIFFKFEILAGLNFQKHLSAIAVAEQRL